jgi:hypothetical protein
VANENDHTALDRVLEGSLSRGELVRRAAAGAGGLALAGTAAAPAFARSRRADATTIKIGFVSPRTGPAAGFGEPDPYVLSLARKAFAKGLAVGGTTYAVEIVDKDGQSNPQRGAQVANDLIHSTGVDLMLATSTPETVNPVSDASEAAGVPCVSTVVPWEAWYYGRGAKPGKPSPFRYTFHFCFGVQQFYLAYTHLWPQVQTNKTVGVMWPNDADGNAIRASLGPLLKKAGYTIVDPSAQTSRGKEWNQQLGASLALFDVAAAVLRASGNPKDKNAVANAMKTLKVETPLGTLAWGKGPVPNVVTTPIIGGQWVTAKAGSKYKLDFVLCEHSADPHVPVAAKLKPYA